MCNDYRLLTATATLFDGFAETKIKIRFSEGKPNIEAREDIKITDAGPIVRATDGESKSPDLVQRRWSWPGPKGKPVYNFRSMRVNGRMRLDKARGTIEVNNTLTLAGIPEKAFHYVLGTRSALEWVVDQYRVEEQSETRATSNPNDPED